MSKNLYKVKELYSDNIEKFGIDSKSVGWPDENTQLLRFKKLLEVIEDKKQPYTINDLGCGYGAQYKFMIENDYNIKKYWGYDISEKMIDSARNYVNSKNATFILEGKLTHKADYSFTSGIFNVKFDENEEKWEAYIMEILNNMNSSSIKGFAFNLLSTYVDYKQKNLYYADPLKYFDYCKLNFSKRVSLLHDYPLYEWTIFVKSD